MAKKIRVRNERVELRLNADEKNLLDFAANAAGDNYRDFVMKLVLKEVKRLKLDPKREQTDLFIPVAGKQIDLF